MLKFVLEAPSFTKERMSPIILFIGLILFISLASANLVITPTSIDIETEINQNNDLSITVFNNYTFDIFDLEFENLEELGFNFSDNISIEKNQTKTIDFNVITTNSYHGLIDSNVKFQFLVDLPEEVTMYNLYLSESGFDEQYLTIRKGDSITFYNEDSITHKIYCSEFGSMTISAGENRQFTFQNMGTFSFYDEDFSEFTFFNGDIEVIDRTLSKKVHNPTYDTTFYVNLESTLENTNMTLELSKSDYEISHSNKEKGLLTIKITGSERGELIKFTSNSEWISFDEDNINLEAGETDWIEYTIVPYLFNTNETNKSYNIVIYAEGSNTEQYSLNLNVFVPYKLIDGSLSTDLDVAQWYLNYYCPKYPCSLFCSPELSECNLNSSGGAYGSGVCSMNVTEDTWYEQQRELSQIKSELARLTNSNVESQDKIIQDLGEIKENANESLTKQLENEKKEKTRNNVLWIFIFFVAIISIVIIVFKTLNKQSSARAKIGGMFNYKSKE